MAGSNVALLDGVLNSHLPRFKKTKKKKHHPKNQIWFFRMVFSPKSIANNRKICKLRKVFHWNVIHLSTSWICFLMKFHRSTCIDLLDHPPSTGDRTLIDPITYQCSSLCSVTYEIHERNRLEVMKKLFERVELLGKNGWNMSIFGENWGSNEWTVEWKVLIHSVEYEHSKMSNTFCIVFIIWSLSFKYIVNKKSGMQQIWRNVRLVSITWNINSVSSDRGSWTFGKSSIPTTLAKKTVPFHVSSQK